MWLVYKRVRVVNVIVSSILILKVLYTCTLKHVVQAISMMYM